MAKKKKSSRRLRKDRLLLLIIIILVTIFLISKIYGVFFASRNSNNNKNNNISVETKIDKKNEKIVNVIIDPAKGGTYEGKSTSSGMMKEKDINLDIAKRVKNKLDKYTDVSCLLTREFDRNKPIPDRISLANKNKSDLFVSIRVNAQSKGSDAKGFETYYSEVSKKKKISKDEDSMSKKESPDSVSKKDKTKVDEKQKISNRSMSESNQDKKDVSDSKINKIKDNSTVEFNDNNLSKKLAKSIQKTSLSYVDMYDRGVINKNFDVLYYTEMPSVIVQCGFISNKKDSELLENEEERENIANGIAEGILTFIDANRSEIIANRVNYN